MDRFSTTLQGLRFGLLLQFAVGPVCLLVLQTSVTWGFLSAVYVVLAVALADAFFIAVSSLGASAVLSVPAVKSKARILGAMILCLLGIHMLLGALNIALLPGIRLFTVSSDAGLFAQGLLLTLSNPLTILFWSGALTAKVTENEWNKSQLAFFSAGCVLATLLFLTAVAALGSILQGKLPVLAMNLLNAVVGAAMILFGIRLAAKRK